MTFDAKWACHVSFENPQVTQKNYTKTMEQLVKLNPKKFSSKNIHTNLAMKLGKINIVA
jgi:hypothetical protein